MSNAQASQWRRAARAAIDTALAGQPPDASEKQKRRAVSGAYPFGPRSGWPYQCWLKEVRAVLGSQKFGDPKPIVFTMTPSHWTTPFYITVRCDWCRGLAHEKRKRFRPAITRGCMMCREHTDTLDGLLSNDDFMAGLKQCRKTPQDPLPRLALADWLAERGLDDLERLFRESVTERTT